MLKNKYKLFAVLLFSITAAFFLFNQFYADVHQSGGIKLKLNSNEIEQKAAVLARDINFETDNTFINSNLSSDENLIEAVQQKYGIKKANAYFRDSLDAYFWEVNWQPIDQSGIHISRNKNDEEVNVNYPKELKLRFNGEGRLLYLFRSIDDTTALPFISSDSAKKFAENFAAKYASINVASLEDTGTGKWKDEEYTISLGYSSRNGYKIKNEKRIEQKNRTDYEFVWMSSTAFEGISKVVKVSTAGNIISSFDLTYEIQSKTDSENVEIFKIISKVVFYIFIFILLAIIAYKRIKAYEIGFRIALILGSVVAVCSGIEIYMNLNAELGWESLIPLVIGPLMFGAGIVLVWGASETITREVWKSKFITIDLATKGYVFHSLTGKAILKGISFGFLISILMLFFTALINSISPLVYYPEEDLLKHLSSLSPALSILINNIYSAIFLAGVFFIFIVSGLKRRFVSSSVLIVICALIWSIANIGDMQPVYLGLLFEFVLGISFIYVFVRTDVLTILFTMITFHTFYAGYAFFTIGNPSFEQAGYFLFVLLLLSVIAGAIAIFTKDKISEYDSITPAFAKNITERQRLQRELEIARDVQMSFLPKTTPSFPGLDIASQCIPALEVGGDYYDFVKIDQERLGIIIGDVSGKGTEAAFYMTLTKGFLKALSRSSDSPAAVLSKMNELFYENVERGTFISMIYGIFDIKNKKLKLSRAGHNPVIVRKQSAEIELINPTGLALGLERGTIFNKTIQEFEVEFLAGDVFIFYTDGFTEAMNSSRGEFGEERLKNIVLNSPHLSSTDMLDNITLQVKQFMGKARQHDDMTMVIVKINSLIL